MQIDHPSKEGGLLHMKIVLYVLKVLILLRVLRLVRVRQ